MADEEHVEILKQGVEAWDPWRKDTPKVVPDLSGADLRNADLTGVDLRNTDLSRADLTRADLRNVDLHRVDLSGADLRNADLSRADLTKADLSGADLTLARLVGANLSGADLTRVTLDGADLNGADLSGAQFVGAKLHGAKLTATILSDANLRGVYIALADLSGVNLRNADLSGADLSGADLSGADLTEATCEEANFSGADLTLARLLDTNLDGAKLTGARLWETQRAGWSIKGVVCESAYWDAEGEMLTSFRPGEFERLYADKVRVLVRYPEGISPLEIVTLPALIRHLEASRPGCKLRFESIQDGPGGAVVTIVVEDSEAAPPGQAEGLMAGIQAEAEQKARQLREALEGEKQSVLLLKGEVRTLERMVDKLLSRPTFYLQGGDAIMGDQYNIGQAGAVGPQSHAHNMTFQQVGGNIEKRMDLSELAGELAALREAMSREAAVAGHYIAVGKVAEAEEAAKAKDSSKVAESLKGAGKWALDVATKIGTTLAAEALKESLGLKK